MAADNGATRAAGRKGGRMEGANDGKRNAARIARCPRSDLVDFLEHPLGEHFLPQPDLGSI